MGHGGVKAGVPGKFGAVQPLFTLSLGHRLAEVYIVQPQGFQHGILDQRGLGVAYRVPDDAQFAGSIVQFDVHIALSPFRFRPIVRQGGIDSQRNEQSHHRLDHPGGGIIIAGNPGHTGNENNAGQNTGHATGGGPLDEQTQPHPRHTHRPQHRDLHPGIVQGRAQQQGGGTQSAAHDHADQPGNSLLKGLTQGALGTDDTGDAGIQRAHLPQYAPQLLPIEQAKGDKQQIGHHHRHGGFDDPHPDAGQGNGFLHSISFTDKWGDLSAAQRWSRSRK